jgi:MoxR-like ATPase
MLKETVSEEVFGPISFTGLQQDKYERITKGMLPQANVAFLDEIWKSNSGILNSLLALMNEREFKNGTNLEKVPLDILVGASNEYPEDSSLNALFDRFLLRFWLDNSSDPDSFRTLIERIEISEKIKQELTREEVVELQGRTEAIPWSKENLNTLTDIWAILKNEGFSSSDRRWNEARKCVKAEAVMSGQKEISPIHFSILKDIMWDKHDDKNLIYSAVLKVADEIATHVSQLQDALIELRGNVDKGHSFDDLALGIKTVKEKIDALSVDNPNDTRMKELQDALYRVNQAVTKRFQEQMGEVGLQLPSKDDIDKAILKRA